LIRLTVTLVGVLVSFLGSFVAVSAAAATPAVAIPEVARTVASPDVFTMLIVGAILAMALLLLRFRPTAVEIENYLLSE